MKRIGVVGKTQTIDDSRTNEEVNVKRGLEVRDTRIGRTQR